MSYFDEVIEPDLIGKVSKGMKKYENHHRVDRNGRRMIENCTKQVPFADQVDKAWEEEIDRVWSRRTMNMDKMIDIEQGHMHTQKDGVKLPIYRMENSHLVNTVSYFARKVRDSYNEVVGGASLLDDIMAGGSTRKAKATDLKEVISEAYVFIGRFVLEGVRRGLHAEMKQALIPFNDVMTALDTYNPTPSVALPSRLSEGADFDLDEDDE